MGTLAVAVAATLSHRVFGAMPHVQDSVAQLFQARIFAGGALRESAPALPQFFQYHHMILADGHWYSQYPPGHPAFLMFGVLAGIPWIIDPLMGGLFVVALVLLGPELFGDERGPLVGRVAGGLALVSPFFLLMSAGFMSHPTALAAATWGLYGYARLVRTGSVPMGLLAGSGFGLALLTRPYSAFGVGVPIAVHALLTWRKSPTSYERLDRGAALQTSSALPTSSVPPTSPVPPTSSVPPRPPVPPTSSVPPRPRWRGNLAMVGAVGVFGLLLLGYNQATNGSPLLFGYEVLYGPSHGIGFGKGSWGAVHTPARGIAQVGSQIQALSGRLFEWPVTSLWPLLFGLFPGPFLARRVFLLLLPISLLGVHVFYWYSDLCFGPRYVYEALGPILLLAAWGLVQVGTWGARVLRSDGAAAPGLTGGQRGRGTRRANRGAKANAGPNPSASASAVAKRGGKAGSEGGGGKPGLRHAGAVRAVDAVSSVGGGKRFAPGGSASRVPSRTAIAVVLLLVALPTAIGMATRWPSLFEPPPPFRGAPAGSPMAAASYFQYFGPSFWGVGPNLHRVVSAEAEAPALVFVRFAEPQIDHPTMRYIQYGSAVAFQNPDLEHAETVYARDLGPENDALVRAYPERAVYLYDGNVESGTLRRIR